MRMTGPKAATPRALAAYGGNSSCACRAIFNPGLDGGSGGQTYSRCARFTLLIATFSRWRLENLHHLPGKSRHCLDLPADRNPVVSAAACFPLPWSHYARLLAVRNLNAREFYQAEALRGGWTIRQLNRQIESQFYERTSLSRDKSKCFAVM